MAGDWIKMRTSLLTNPKVNGIARELEASAEVSERLSTGFRGTMDEIVTRNVMRHVTVSCLLVIWGAANEHTKDGVFRNADHSDIDDMVGIPGFAAAMELVGWLNYDEESNSVTLPNFIEYNTSGDVRSAGAKSNAQRQKEYRDRKIALSTPSESNVTSCNESNVTSNRREEKKREEENQNLSSSAAPSDGTGDELAQRLAQVTRDALTAYNASPLTKRNGGNLPNVSETVGREKRQHQVRRCLRVAREICRESTGTPLVTPEFWVAYFDLVAQDDFYAGRVPGGQGHENFVPDFETLTSEKTMLRLYDRQVAA
ncbi:hypothetical protein [Xanthomonas citri]|uniref:hypothetical protein n=1 Tax=Xanthomonas citri TaxID=346 RepID=UPI000B5CB022|nr:hypothetical protein [Xanthomonas citri]ASL01785.1 hypothetical protein XcvCFBP7113P_16820 [Xanthomonas citri pv. vignicola]